MKMTGQLMQKTHLMCLHVLSYFLATVITFKPIQFSFVERVKFSVEKGEILYNVFGPCFACHMQLIRTKAFKRKAGHKTTII